MVHQTTKSGAEQCVCFSAGSEKEENKCFNTINPNTHKHLFMYFTEHASTNNSIKTFAWEAFLCFSASIVFYHFLCCYMFCFKTCLDMMANLCFAAFGNQFALMILKCFMNKYAKINMCRCVTESIVFVVPAVNAPTVCSSSSRLPQVSPLTLRQKKYLSCWTQNHFLSDRADVLLQFGAHARFMCRPVIICNNISTPIKWINHSVFLLLVISCR